MLLMFKNGVKDGIDSVEKQQDMNNIQISIVYSVKQNARDLCPCNTA